MPNLSIAAGLECRALYHLDLADIAGLAEPSGHFYCKEETAVW